MRIVFIYNGTESLGIEYLSGLLKSKGHEVYLFFDPAVFQGEIFINVESLAKRYDLSDKIIERAVKLAPDLVGFSCFTGNYQWSLKIAKAISERSDAAIVFGGVHPTAVPEKVLSNDFIDYVVIGEAEYALLDLIENLKINEARERLLKTPNICFKCRNQIIFNKPRPYIENLDSLPFPDKHLFFDEEPLLMKNPYLIMTSRGCPYSCNYCSNSMFKNLYACEKQHVRRRSPDNVIKELLFAKEKWNIKKVYFMDDVFTISQQWLEQFINKYTSEINLPFYCYTHPLSMTRETASLLKKGGCYLVGMGVQSGAERIRKDIYNRHDSNEKIIQSISCLKANNIKVQVDHILGAPSENEEDLKQSLELYRLIKPEIILTFWLTYYPKTDIINIAQKFGIISAEDIDDIENGRIGYTHNFGSVSKDLVPLFNKYELLIELSAFCRNDFMYNILSGLASIWPFKKMTSYLLYAIAGLRYNRDYILNKFTYAFKKIFNRN